MMDIAMIITTISVMYLATWALYSHDKMSGVVPSILAVIAATAIMLEFAAYMVVLLPILPWSISAAVVTATATLVATCSLARSAEARNKLRGKKSR